MEKTTRFRSKGFLRPDRAVAFLLGCLVGGFAMAGLLTVLHSRERAAQVQADRRTAPSGRMPLAARPLQVGRPLTARRVASGETLTMTAVGTTDPHALPVRSAEPNGRAGELPRALVDELLDNPFDELKNIRLRPYVDSGDLQGLQVQWLNKDSLLYRLGVRKGDVVRSINGVPFLNMADIVNSMNTLTGSERFDIEIVRDGIPAVLKYVVR